jgi:hypothetical protein
MTKESGEAFEAVATSPAVRPDVGQAAVKTALVSTSPNWRVCRVCLQPENPNINNEGDSDIGWSFLRDGLRPCGVTIADLR